jgi:hypothetical protein
MVPIFLLDLKIYGQWMSGGDRRLSKVATPTNHLAVVGNFVGALLGAKMGLREVPIFFFAIGVVHYLVLFVTLYQRLPTNAQLPRELHPVFFLFIAAPSVASVGWARLCGDFNYAAKIFYFTHLGRLGRRGTSVVVLLLCPPSAWPVGNSLWQMVHLCTLPAAAPSEVDDVVGSRTATTTFWSLRAAAAGRRRHAMTTYNILMSMSSSGGLSLDLDPTASDDVDDLPKRLAHEGHNVLERGERAGGNSGVSVVGAEDVKNGPHHDSGERGDC